MKLFRCGRRAPVHTRRTLRSALALARALDPLGPAPPISDDYVTPLQRAIAALSKPPDGGQFGMYLNDQLGDCVCADSAHQVMLHTANAGSIIVPSDQDVLAMYEAVGGYVPNESSTDQGCSETAACQYLMAKGLAGQQSAGAGPLDPTNLEHIRWTVQLFGACRLGIIVDERMESEFSSGEPWTQAANPDDPGAGGHDVPIVRYDAEYAYVITWGALQPVAWSLLSQQQFLEEAHAEAWPDFCTAGGTAPNGFSLAALLNDLEAITVSEP